MYTKIFWRASQIIFLMQWTIYNYSFDLFVCLHGQKSWENHEKKTENSPQFSQNENIFVKIGELFANFEKNKMGNIFCISLKIFIWFLPVYLSNSVISTNPDSTDTKANIYVIDVVNSISHGTILQTRSSIVSSQSFRDVLMTILG